MPLPTNEERLAALRAVLAGHAAPDIELGWDTNDREVWETSARNPGGFTLTQAGRDLSDLIDLLAQLEEAKDPAEQARLLSSAIYEQPHGAAGCCLHVVIDDGNWELEHREFVLEWAKRHEHPLCIATAELLLRITDDPWAQPDG